MNKKNVAIVGDIINHLIREKIVFRIIDDRWKRRGDVDLLVLKHSLRKMENIFEKYGFKRTHIYPFRTISYRRHINGEFVFLGAHVGSKNRLWGGTLGHELGKAVTFSQPPRDDPYLSKEKQAWIMLVKCATRGKKDSYVQHFDTLVRGKLNLEKMKPLIVYSFVNHQNILEDINKKKSANNINLVIRPKFSARKQSFIYRTIKFTYKCFYPAPYICLVGCNGAGKTTATEHLSNTLQAQKLKVFSMHSGRYRFSFLPIRPILDRIRPARTYNKKTSEVDRVREIKIYDSKILRCIAPFVIYFEYLMRYIFIIYPKRITHDIVITDRSFIDVFNSPNLNLKICAILYRLLPQPRHIYLYNDAKELAQRRPELYKKYIIEQLERYGKLIRYYDIKIKTSGSESHQKISNYVASLFDKKMSLNGKDKIGGKVE